MRFDRYFDVIVTIIIIITLIIVVYPLYFILIASVSDPDIVNSGKILLWPEGFNLNGYEKIFKDNSIWTGYRNTIIYTVSGTVLATFITLLAGYSLSYEGLPGKNIFMGIFVFTMFFNGGLIPTYLVVKDLHLVNNPLVIVILGCCSVYNIIITRSFFQATLPKELKEAAEIDGCSIQKYFFIVVIPISKAIIAVIALYYAVGYWNAFFDAMIYLNEQKFYPLQLILRDILLSAQSLQQESMDMSSMGTQQNMVQVIKYGVIVVSTLPVLCLYPFLQKYFVQGVMIGSIKG